MPSDPTPFFLMLLGASILALIWEWWNANDR